MLRLKEKGFGLWGEGFIVTVGLGMRGVCGEGEGGVGCGIW